MGQIIKFDRFVFKAAPGELIYCDETGKESVTRLQPQPARLLKLLIDHYPEIVSRDTIRKTIWPDVRVDFDGSMHFCIRQIRAALNDDAANPKFIETIPRRGYRWLSEPLDAQGRILQKKSRLKRSWVWGLAGMMLAAFLLYLVSAILPADHLEPVGHEKPRVAIMPFQPSDTANAFSGNDIALQLLEDLTNRYRDQFDVIGPTTTSTFDPNDLRTHVSNHNIDFLINGRFSQPDNNSRMLVEIIRATDGAHIWVRSYFPPVSEDSVILETKKGIEEHILF